MAKFNICCDFRGNLVLYSGLHLGVRHDLRIARRDVEPYMHPQELGIGDGAYIHSRRILAKFPAPHSNTRRRKACNKVIDFHRAKIEHMVRNIKLSRQLFRQAWRGRLTHLNWLVKITAHITAFKLRNFGPLGQDFGKWAHWWLWRKNH